MGGFAAIKSLIFFVGLSERDRPERLEPVAVKVWESVVDARRLRSDDTAVQLS